MMISVCLASYNGEKYIREQIQTILEELGPSDELIISDDGSEDGTIGIIQSYQDTRIRLFAGQSFRSPVYNFEFALKQAKGDLIFLSDQDDRWVQGRIAMACRDLEQHDVVVLNHMVFHEEDGEMIIPSFFDAVSSRPGLLKNLIRNSYTGCCMGFRSSVLRKALPFPLHVPMHDIWLGIVSDLHFNVHFNHFIGTERREHGKNASSSSQIRSPHSLSRKIKFRMQALRLIAIALFR